MIEPTDDHLAPDEEAEPGDGGYSAKMRFMLFYSAFLLISPICLLIVVSVMSATGVSAPHPVFGAFLPAFFIWAGFEALRKWRTTPCVHNVKNWPVPALRFCFPFMAWMVIFAWLGFGILAVLAGLGYIDMAPPGQAYPE